MAAVATPSKFAMKWNALCGVIILGMAAYFYYDGNYNKAYIEKNTIDGKPNLDLRINQSYGPIGCVLTSIYFGFLVFSMSKKRVVVDEKGMTFHDGKNIPLDCLTKIDKSKLKTKGKLFIEYEMDGQVATVVLKDTEYDNINGVLDEILRLTGQESSEASAEPESPEKEENA